MPSNLQPYSPASEMASPVPATDGVDRNSDGTIANDIPENCDFQPACSSKSVSCRKRKAADDEDDEDEDEDEDDGELRQPIKKTAHNMIEKRYRTNLNDKISSLRDSVPSLRIMSKTARGEDTTQDREELHGLTPAHKLNKATVLSKATEYIRHLEKLNSRMEDENAAMVARINAFEKLFMTGPINGALPAMQQSFSPLQFNGNGSTFINPNSSSPHPHPPSQQQQQTQAASGASPATEQAPAREMKPIMSTQIVTSDPPFQVGVPPSAHSAFMTNPDLIRQLQIQQQQLQQQQLQQRRWQQNAPPGYYAKMMGGSLSGLM